MKKRQPKPDEMSIAKDGRRSRRAVLKDFEKVAGPLRGQNRDQKPKA